MEFIFEINKFHPEKNRIEYKNIVDVQIQVYSYI